MGLFSFFANFLRVKGRDVGDTAIAVAYKIDHNAGTEADIKVQIKELNDLNQALEESRQLAISDQKAIDALRRDYKVTHSNVTEMLASIETLEPGTDNFQIVETGIQKGHEKLQEMKEEMTRLQESLAISQETVTEFEEQVKIRTKTLQKTREMSAKEQQRAKRIAHSEATEKRRQDTFARLGKFDNSGTSQALQRLQEKNDKREAKLNAQRKTNKELKSIGQSIEEPNSPINEAMRAIRGPSADATPALPGNIPDFSKKRAQLAELPSEI